MHVYNFFFSFRNPPVFLCSSSLLLYTALASTPRILISLFPPLALDEVARLLAYHHGNGVGVGGGRFWNYTRVDDAKPLDAVHLQLGRHHRCRVGYMVV